MGLKKNKSAITHIEIGFREIERFFDAHGSPDPKFAARIPSVDSNGVPRIVVRDPFQVWGQYSVGLTDENGDAIRFRMPELEGVYRTIRTSGEAAFIRTFARKRSNPIDRKYVYVWAADDKKGGGMRLVRELYFSQGKFRLIDFKSKRRQPKGQARERLVLDLAAFQDAQPKRVYYFFLLARHQISRKRLDDMMPEVPARGMRLWDEFYTDICPDGDLSNAMPVDGPPREGAELPPKLTYLMHLVDPFSEALHRSERYKNALHRWQQVEASLSQDVEYVLAKGVELLRDQSTDSCSDALAGSFSSYLSDREAESKRLLFVSFTLASDLVQWIGRREKREPLRYKVIKTGEEILCDTWFGNTTTRIPSREDKPADEWHSHYSQALRDYATPEGDLTGDPKVANGIARIICAVVEELDQSPWGANWLEDMVKKGIEGDLDKVAPAGFEFFFLSRLSKSEDGGHGEGGEEPSEKKSEGEGHEEGEEKEDEGAACLADVRRKKNEAAKGVVAGMLMWVGKPWVEHYREDALKSLKNFFKAKHGITLVEKEAGVVRQERRVVESQARRDFKHARRRGVKRLEVQPSAVEGWAFAVRQLQLLQAGLEVVNFCYAAEEAKSGDPWKVLEAMGALMDASKAIYEKFHPEDLVSEVEEEASFVSKGFRVVGFASAAIDIITGAHGIYVSPTLAGQVSEGMKTLGAGLVFGGGFVTDNPGTFPVGLAVMTLGAALEGVGSYWKGQSSEICEFLRNCKWGSGPSYAERIGSVVKDVDSYWYRGKLSDLKSAIAVQQNCINQISYNYTPEIQFDCSSSSCAVKVRMTGAKQSLGPAANWNVAVEATKSASENGPDAVKRTVRLQRDEGFDDLDWTASEWVTFQGLTAEEICDSHGVRRIWFLEVKVTASVDVAGDFKRVITREADCSYTYASQDDSPATPQFDYGTPGPTDSSDAGVPDGGPTDAGYSPGSPGGGGAADLE